ncbi:MAG: hypothetical protein RL417_1248 [Pseudomonadota bacterium]
MNQTLRFAPLQKLSPGDRVAVLSPSFAAPGRWPHVYELGLERLRKIFQLEPVEYPTTKKLGASSEEKAQDLIAAFESPDVKAVISSIGGDDQVTWIKNLPAEPFRSNPKPFFGYSDNTHFMNFLWLLGVPSYYGGALFTEFAMQGRMDEMTERYLRRALFEGGAVELASSEEFNDIGLSWEDPALLSVRRRYQPQEGWYWDGGGEFAGVTWGGCLESIDELLRHRINIPSLPDFEEVILLLETSEEIPPAAYVYRVIRALGELGILARIRGLLVGRPKAWEFDRQLSDDEKAAYKKEQREVIVSGVRAYNPNVPIVQNLDFGHTAPQICIPLGSICRIDGPHKRIVVNF